eukprot:scaffold13.g404.t1
MRTLLEFRAGRMVHADGRLSADPRKGRVCLATDEDGLRHFQWFERLPGQSAEAELDIVAALPGEAAFEKVGRPGARVFLLKFPDDPSRNLFFWAQEPDAAQDDSHVTRINELLEGAEDAAEGMEGVEQQVPAPAPASQPATGAAAGPPDGGAVISASLLAAALGTIMGGSQRQQLAGPSLLEVLRPEAVCPLVDDALAARLAPHLPPSYQSPAAIRDLIASPQWRHQVRLLSHALQSGELDTSQFGLPPGGLGVLEFLAAIQKQADEKRVQQGRKEAQGGSGAGHS